MNEMKECIKSEVVKTVEKSFVGDLLYRNCVSNEISKFSPTIIVGNPIVEVFQLHHGKFYEAMILFCFIQGQPTVSQRGCFILSSTNSFVQIALMVINRVH